MKINAATWAGLRFFNHCSQALSFTAAARELNVTTGAVSQQIKQLENQLGYRLFKRTTRQLQLTAEGLQLAEVCNDAYGRIGQRLATIDSARSRGAVRLVASPSFTLQWLVPRLGDFYRHHPQIDLRIDAREEVEALDPLSYDLAVDYLRLDQSHANCELLLQEQLIPVCAPDLLPQRRPLADPRWLLNYPLLHDSNPWPGGGADQEWRHWLQQQQLDIGTGQQIYFNRSDLAVEAAQRGQGIALGRWALVGPLVDEGKLAVAFPHPIPSPAGYYLYRSTQSAYRSTAIEALRQWLCDSLGRPLRKPLETALSQPLDRHHN